MRITVYAYLHLLEMLVPLLTVGSPEPGIFAVQRFAEAEDVRGKRLLHILNIPAHHCFVFLLDFGLERLHIGWLAEIDGALDRSKVDLDIDPNREFGLTVRADPGMDTALRAGDDESNLASIGAGDIAVSRAYFI